MVKVDENVRKELIENMKVRKRRIVKRFDEYIKALENAETVEEIMKEQRDLLIDYVREMPTDTLHCYFCLTSGCSKCKYAKYHCVCSDNQSTYKRIERAKIKLIEALKKYYQGEKYDE